MKRNSNTMSSNTSDTKFVIPPSELIINEDGSIFHLHIRPEHLADKVVVCGDPGRVDMIASHFDTREVDISSREFHTITGTYKGKRITVLSHGIGGDNIEIVMNELDALANIDFETRTAKDEHRELTIVRVGTSGGLQDFVPIGTYVAAEYAIGFDGVIYFYQDASRVCDNDYTRALEAGLDWKIEGLKPYVVPAPKDLLDRICGEDVVRGSTIACNGFYAPQGRRLRGALADPDLNRKIGDFEYQGHKITNFEMESSALAGLGAILGHQVMTVCTIIAGRKSETMNTEYKGTIEGLIKLVLDRI
ncbi:MAG: nucleoside phosphorylase [Porphyromonas sp.]|nr:nucleoside phosphorylase [Porphyromonas sp.]